MHLPLADMTDLARLANVPENANLYLHCGGGYRSVIAASLLKRQGFHNLRNVLGGWNALKQLDGLPIEKETAALN
jgi:rhodanese-related sulfurtransferase